MFVAATLDSEAGACPIHIRNMSLHGALIEGSALPDLGPVTLRRGGLHASARIVWRAGRKAGIAFEGAIHAEEWMSRDSNSPQVRVDEIVRAARGKGGVREPSIVAPSAIAQALSLEAELEALRGDLSELGKLLARDVIVVATHPEIQLIDVALQRVERLLRGAGRTAG